MDNEKNKNADYNAMISAVRNSNIEQSMKEKIIVFINEIRTGKSK